MTTQYAYHPGTGIVRTLAHKNGAATLATRTLHRDLAGQTTGVETKTPAGTTLLRLGYKHDGAGRRTRATRETGAYWAYGYNDRGEVTSAKKHLAAATPIPGHQFELMLASTRTPAGLPMAVHLAPLGSHSTTSATARP